MINVKNKSVEQHQDILATRVAGMIAIKENISPTDAIRKLMATETYGLLLDAEAYLHFESAEYIFYMYEAEQHQDWERWLKL